MKRNVRCINIVLLFTAIHRNNPPCAVKLSSGGKLLWPNIVGRLLVLGHDPFGVCVMVSLHCISKIVDTS